MKNNATLKTLTLGVTAIAMTVMLATSCSNNEKHDDGKMAMDTNGQKSTTVSEMDAQFLKEVQEINQEEIMLGQLAQSNATAADTKDLGKMMEESHTRCENELNDLVTKKSVVLMAVSTDNAMDAQKKLSDKTGMDFDKKYCDMMIDGHKKAIEKFEKASTECNDADVKAFAMNILPQLREHLDHAKMCKENCDKM